MLNMRRMKESIRAKENSKEETLKRYKLSLESAYHNPEVFFPDELNLEMIAYQNDPTFLKEASTAIGEICAVTNEKNIKLSKKEGKDYLVALEKILADRFGVNFILGYNSITNAFCVPFGSKFKFNYNDYTDYLDAFEKLDRAKLDSSKKAIIEGDAEVSEAEIDKERWDPWARYKGTANTSLFAFLDQVKKEGIEVDVKNAKFINAPKGLKFYINVDWYNFKYILKLTDREILAVMMHELGHCWTHLLYCYKVFSNIQVLNDVIREEYSRRNKTSVETIKIFYNKTGLPESKSNSKNITELTIKAYKDILRGSSIGLTSNHSTTDSEQQADEFASRMGLSTELITGLDKLGLTAEHTRYEYIGAAITSLGIITIIPILALGITGAVVPALGLTGLLGLLLTWLGVSSLGPDNLYGKNVWITYDDAYMRYKRIRNTTVRKLAFIEDKAVKDEILDNIDSMDKIYKRILEATKDSMWKKISDALCKDAVQYDEVKVDEMLEALTANEIYVAHARLERRS